MNFKQAFKIVSTWVEVTSDGEAEICAVDDKPYGWVFYYQSKGFDPEDMSTYLVGNTPVVFDRTEGEVRVIPNLKVYEATLPEAIMQISPEVSGFQNKC